MNSRRSNSGQAVIEYLIIFGFMSLLAINLSKGIGSSMESAVGSLGHVLTQQLSVGACATNCFGYNFVNKAIK